MIVLTNIEKFIDTIKYSLEADTSLNASYPLIIMPYNKYPEQYILFNVEQLSSNRQLNKIKEIYKTGKVIEIWDYSQANINILLNSNITAKYIKIKSPPWYLEKLKQYRKEYKQQYEIGFNGLLTPRRKEILDELEKKGIYVHKIIKIYGKYRDIELAKCKMILNIHALDDYKIFEVNRCEPWLAIGVPIISENSLDNDNRCINVEFEKIVETVIYRMQNKNYSI